MNLEKKSEEEKPDSRRLPVVTSQSIPLSMLRDFIRERKEDLSFLTRSILELRDEFSSGHRIGVLIPKHSALTVQALAQHL